MRRLLTLLLISIVLFSCKKEDDSYRLKIFYVAAQKGTFTDWTGQSGSTLMVKEKPGEPYKALGQGIEGFNHEDGFEYKIEVIEVTLKNPPADATNKRYIIKRIISKQ